MDFLSKVKGRYWLVIWLIWLLILYIGLLIIHSVQPQVHFGDYFHRWDSNWYAMIIDHGYQKPPFTSTTNVAFFPLLPLIVLLFAKLGFPSYYTGAIICSLIFLLALYFLQKLLLKNFSTKITVLTLSFIAFNPFSFFFGILYTESLFFLLGVLLFLFLKQKKYWQAAIIACIAGLARSTGLLLILIFSIYIIYLNRHIIKHKFVTIIAQILVAISGFITWLAYLKLYTGDFIAFYHVQKFWFRNSGMQNLLWQFNYMYEGIYKLHYYSFFMLIYFLSTFLLFYAGVYWIFKKNYFYSLYCIGVAILGLASFSVTSMNRYALVVFPLWVAVASLPIIQKIRLRYIIPVICLASLTGVICYGYTPVIFIG